MDFCSFLYSGKKNGPALWGRLISFSSAEILVDYESTWCEEVSATWAVK